MKFNLQYLDDVFEIKAVGVGDVKGISSFLKAVLDHEKWEPGGKFLVDFTELDLGELTVNEVRDIARVCGQFSALFGRAKCAIIATRDLEFGMVRMWEVFVEDRWEVNEELFHSGDEAIAWLIV